MAEFRSAGSVTFAAYAAGWLAGFIDDAPDRVPFEVALSYRLLPVLGQLPLMEVLKSDRNELDRRLLDAGGEEDDRAVRECLDLTLEDAVEDLRGGVSMSALECGRLAPAVEPSSSRPCAHS